MGTNNKRSVAKSHKSWCWPAAGGSSHWTNELHLQYLNSVEASFVRALFCDDDDDDVDDDDHHRDIDNNITTSILSSAGGHSPPPPLDRYLPDSYESTLDLIKSTHDHLHRPRTRRRSASDILDQRERVGRRLVRSSRSRRSECQVHHHDQVVPQLEK